jgi:hypothetical protein
VVVATSPQVKKKADAGKHPKVLNHVGLLFNEPPGTAGLPFIKSSENLDRSRRNAYSDPAHYYTIHYIDAQVVDGVQKKSRFFARCSISCSAGYRDRRVSLLAE